MDATDFTVGGTTATVMTASAVAGMTGAYDVTVSGDDLANLTGTVTLSFAGTHNIQDAANNALTDTAPTGANDNTYMLDNTAPTVTITDVPATSSGPFTATFTFPEAVTGFAAGAITLGNATASNFTVTSTTVYTALITPTADGTVTVDVAANAAQDLAGNGNTAATRASSSYTLPAITIAAVTSPVTEGAAAAFTLSRTGSATAALTVNVTVSETADMVAPADEGARTVTFGANSATAALPVATLADSVDEADSAVTVTLSADTANPATYTVGTPSSATLTVSDDDTRGVTVSVPTLAVNEGSTGVYTVALDSRPTESVTVTPSSDNGEVTVTGVLTFTTANWNTAQPVTVTAAQDSDAVDDSATISHVVAGGDYASVTATSVVVTVDDDETPDTTAPRVASIVRQIPPSSPTNADSLVWRVSFSETVSGVDAADFTVGGTTATVMTASAVAGMTGAYDVTASGGDLANLTGPVTLSFAVGQDIQDAANNALTDTAPTGANDNSYVLDNIAPTVTIADVPPTSTAPFTATFTFPEAVTGFDENDITLGNATASNFTGSDGDTVYTALITPTADGTVTVDVAANAAQDLAGNGNTAATRASSTYTLPAITIAAVTSPVTEGAAAAFTLSRTGSATAALTVNVTVSETADMVAPADEGARTVTFGANSATAALPVATLADSVDEADSVVTATLSADTANPATYTVGTPSLATLTVSDDDTRGVTVSVPTLAVNEGSTGSYTVALDSRPTASVTVTPSSDNGEVTVTGVLSFTTANWNTAQPVTVTAAQDSDAVDDRATISHVVAGGDYSSVTATSVVVTVDDDETADTTAPVLVTAQVDGETLTLTYNEALDTGSAPAPGDFSVSVAGQTAPVSGVALSGAALTLTLAVAVLNTDTVTVTYTPGSTPIQDLAGNDAADIPFPGRVVDNVTVSPPGAPGRLAAIAGNGQVGLGWAAPSEDGGAAIVGYEYRVSPDGGSSWSPDWSAVPDGPDTGNAAADERAYVVTGLANGTAYTFQVRAVNMAGKQGAPAQDEATPQTGPAADPGAPRGFAARAGDAAVTLSWQAPLDTGNRPLLRYEVRYAEGSTLSAGVSWQDAGTVLTYTVAGLTNGRQHTFEVRAVNTADRAGAAARARALPEANADVPGPVRNLRAAARDYEVALYWHTPARAGRTAITHYEFRYARGRSVPASTAWVRVHDTAGNGRVVDGLENGVAYTFEVRAVNAAGAGALAQVRATPGEPALRAPGSPGNLGAVSGEPYVDGTNGIDIVTKRAYVDVTLSWAAPAQDGDDPIFRYEYPLSRGQCGVDGLPPCGALGGADDNGETAHARDRLHL